jgi:phage baseplate assembly protein W
MSRHDYAFPFRISSVSGQGAQSPYGTHVEQMVRQVLLTSPGERADLPEFGCGLRQLLFTPNSDALLSTTKLMVLRSLDRWLARQIEVKDVQVSSGEGGDYSQILVQIAYVLVETQSKQITEIRLNQDGLQR